MPEVQNLNLSKIIKQLELIKGPISLEQEGEIDVLWQTCAILFEKSLLISLSK